MTFLMYVLVQMVALLCFAIVAYAGPVVRMCEHGAGEGASEDNQMYAKGQCIDCAFIAMSFLLGWIVILDMYRNDTDGFKAKWAAACARRAKQSLLQFTANQVFD